MRTQSWPDSSRISLALPLVATIAYWPVRTTIDVPTPDLSWQVSLHMAIQQGLQWGSDLSFTYGPLGFLSTSTPYAGWTSTVAFLFALGVYSGLAMTVFLATARALPWWLSVVITIGGARFFVAVPAFEAAELLAFLGALLLVVNPPRRWRVVCIGAGIVAGALVLGKFNVGLFVAAMGAILAVRIGRPWWQGLATFGLTMAAATTGLWLLAGQELANLSAFLVDSLDLARGYSDAMAINLFPLPFVVELLFLAAIILLCLGGVRRWTALDSVQRATSLLLLATVVFALWKGAITRADGHVELAFAAIPIMAGVLLADRQRWQMAGFVWFALYLVSQLFTVSAQSIIDAPNSVAGFIDEVASALPGRGSLALEGSRADVRTTFGLDKETERQVANNTVAFDPWDSAIAFGYPEIRWAPVPSLQSYVAFTERLDLANAAFLRSTSAPERILRATPLEPGGAPRSLDGRNPWYESPAAMLESLCRYKPIEANLQWQVLARTSSECGRPELLATITALAGDTIQVPSPSRPDAFVLVRIHGLGASPIDAVRAALWKGVPWYIAVDGAIRYRLIAGTAADGLLMAVPDGVRSAGPFDFGPPTESIEVSAGSEGNELSATLTYEFLTVPWDRQP